MNYEDGKALLPSLDRLKYKKLIISNEWTIINIALLPKNENTLTAYIPPMNWFTNGQWLANGVNHEMLYEKSGIYYKQDGTHFDDNLTIYIIVKRDSGTFSAEYKCDFLSNLLSSGEIKKGDIPSFVLQVL
jgi:hypothetical protein